MWLIVGYGNPLRGDDGAGPLVAERLAARLPEEQFRLVRTQQLMPELALEIAAAEISHVLFIDATRNQIQAVNLVPLQPAATDSCGHQMSPQLLLELAARLYARTVPGWLLTIGGEEFCYAEQLSAAAQKNCGHGVRRALDLLQA